MPVIDEAARITGEIAELRHAIHRNRTGYPEPAEKEARARWPERLPGLGHAAFGGPPVTAGRVREAAWPGEICFQPAR